MSRSRSGWTAAALALAVACGPAGTEGVHRTGTMSHAPLREVSGLQRSVWPGVFWVHNDSGDRARLFAIDAAGKLVLPPDADADRWPGILVPDASNVDWEDLARSDGILFVADMGNNGNDRRDLGVYVVEEPDPRRGEPARLLRFLPIRYPDQDEHPARLWHFDCEAVFHDGGHLYFLTKHRQPGRESEFEDGTKLYRLDTEHTDRHNVLTLVSRRNDLPPVTAADLSPSGEHLAVLAHDAVWLFERPGDDDWLAGRSSRLHLDRRTGRRLEAITWLDDRTLILAGEDRRMFEVATSAFEALH